jgi:hypothetical protein
VKARQQPILQRRHPRGRGLGKCTAGHEIWGMIWRLITTSPPSLRRSCPPGRSPQRPAALAQEQLRRQFPCLQRRQHSQLKHERNQNAFTRMYNQALRNMTSDVAFEKGAVLPAVRGARAAPLFFPNFAIEFYYPTDKTLYYVCSIVCIAPRTLRDVGLSSLAYGALRPPVFGRVVHCV